MPDQSTGDGPPVRVEVRDGVGIISLARPHRHNALNDEARSVLAEAFGWAGREDAIGAVLLRGDGPSFCSGRDRSGFLNPAGHGSHRNLIEAAQAVRMAQAGLGKPTVCAMRGHVIGAGAELALGCDNRLAANDLRFSFPEVGFGVVADTGSSLLLTRLVGPARAKWLLMSGVPVGADEAVRWGLAEWAVDPDRLDEEAFAAALRLAGRPRQAVARQKALVESALPGSLREALSREMAAQLALFEGDEYRDLASQTEARRRDRAYGSE